VISTTIRLKKKNDKTTNNYRPFSNPLAAKAKQEELLINETELPTASRHDRISSRPTIR
jgi:hypothetical protein